MSLKRDGNAGNNSSEKKEKKKKREKKLGRVKPMKTSLLALYSAKLVIFLS